MRAKIPRAMQVVHIITRLDRGGSAQNTLLTCLGLSQAKYQIVLVHGLALESRMTEREKQSVGMDVERARMAGLKVIPLPSLVRSLDPFRDVLAFFSLWKILAREKPLIVHTHSSKAGILGRWAAKMAGTPIIVHTPHGHVFYGHFGTITSSLFLLLEKITSRITHITIALTQAERNDYISYSIARPERIVTIHSGVDIERYSGAKVNVVEKKRSLGLAPDGLVVGTVGWLLPVKGPMYLLKAMERVWENHGEIKLIFVGKGGLEWQLRAEASRAGVSSKVGLLGWRDDVPEIMQILDVFVLPSLNEGMGRVLVEAMAAGKPIIASRAGGIVDLIKDGENGLLIEPGDVDGLYLAIERLLNDTKMRYDMGQRGKVIARGFSLERMLEKIEVLYSSLIHQLSNKPD